MANDFENKILSMFIFAFQEKAKAMADLYCHSDCDESPIENLMCAAFEALKIAETSIPIVGIFEGDVKFSALQHINHDVIRRNAIYIYRQVEYEPYKLDFLCMMSFGDDRVKSFTGISEISRAFVAVECDGHEFHERTKEQAEKDKKRDRFLLKRGIPTLRFTGGEIYRNPSGCAFEVAEYFVMMIDTAKTRFEKLFGEDLDRQIEKIESGRLLQ